MGLVLLVTLVIYAGRDLLWKPSGSSPTPHITIKKNVKESLPEERKPVPETTALLGNDESMNFPPLDKSTGDPESGPDEFAQPQEQIKQDAFEIVEMERPYQTVTVNKGDSLSKLTKNIYGSVDMNIIHLIWKYNPEIKEIDWIEEGQELLIPSPWPSRKDPVFTIQVATLRPFEERKALLDRLLSQPYPMYILPEIDDTKAGIYRVTVGVFESQESAWNHAALLREKGFVGNPKVIELQTR
jgi:hypothetical protein